MKVNIVSVFNVGNVELKAQYLLEFLLENNYTTPMTPSPKTRVQSNGNDKPLKSKNKKPTDGKLL